MSINFPDLQVLLPRTEEIARATPAGQQQDFNQQALAQAAMVRAEREPKRIARSRQGERSGRTRKEQLDGQETQPRTRAQRHPRGKGDRLDIQA